MKLLILMLLLVGCTTPATVYDSVAARQTGQAAISQASGLERRETVSAQQTEQSLRVLTTEEAVSQSREQNQRVATMTAQAYTQTVTSMIASRTEAAIAQRTRVEQTQESYHQTIVASRATETSVSLRTIAEATKTSIEIRAQQDQAEQAKQWQGLSNMANSLLPWVAGLDLAIVLNWGAIELILATRRRSKVVIAKNKTGEVIAVVVVSDDPQTPHDVIYPRLVQPVRPLELPATSASLAVLHDWKSKVINETEAPHIVQGLIDERDLRYFCEQLSNGVKHSEVNWIGHKLPHGYDISNPQAYLKLIQLFLDCNPPLIVNRDGATRKSGVLVTKDVSEMMGRLTRIPERQEAA